MNLVHDILEELWNTEIRHKGMTVNIFGIPRFRKHSKTSLQSTLSRLRKKGFISSKNTQLYITLLGKKYITKNKLKQFEFTVKDGMPKNLLIMFDIPELRKREREWFRRHLRKLDYIMVQKSAWVGPSPLPKEFIEYIKEIKLKDSLKTFKLAKGYRPNH